MKKITLIAILFITSISFSQVPDYFPLGAVWNEVYQEETGGNMTSVCGSVSTYNLSIQEDVLLGTKMYKRMHKNGILSSHYSLLLPQDPEHYDPSCDFTLAISSDYYVRQDNQKIYVYLTDTTEHLLYDYDMVVGDTFYFSGLDIFNFFSNDSIRCVVDSIGSISVEGSLRSVFYLSHDDYGGLSGVVDTNSVFIEGIGNLGGFFCGISRFTEYTTRTLECFGINNIPYWTGSNGICDLSVGIKPIEENIDLSYYPNPVKDKMDFEIPESFEISEIEIVDLLGEKEKVKFNRTKTNRLTIDLSEFNSGIYFLKLIDSSMNSFDLKIIKE